jgi:tetratricopeptide (TPR) repeat protein
MSDSADLKTWLASAKHAALDPVAAAGWLRQANGRGEYLLAISFAEQALGNLTPDIAEAAALPVRQQFALALARSGSLEGALAVLKPLHEAGRRDAETLGLLGRVHKDFAEKADSPQTRREHFERARDFYLEGFDRHADPYCGINAAALSVLTDQKKAAEALAMRLLEAPPAREEYWSLATAAEAHLILGHLEESRRLYAKAGVLAGGRRGDLASTKRQCRILGEALADGAERIFEEFPGGAVAIFAGHRPDLPGRRKPRLPEEAFPGLRKRMLAWLLQNQVRVVYASAAAGADLVFLESAKELGVETHVFLPFPEEGFLRRSVQDCGPEWERRFHLALAAADSVTVVEDQTPMEDGAALQFCIRLLTAAGSSIADASEWPLRALAVWDGLPAAGPGGTADSVAFWNSAGLPVQIFHPIDTARDGMREPEAGTPGGRPFANIHAAHPEGVKSEIAVMLGLHVGGYEKLPDSGFVALDRDVFGRVADLLAERGWFSSCQGGFGDYIFPWVSTAAAGLAALEILRVLEDGARAQGLDLRFSMCLHVAPMQTVVNPLLNHYSHEGRAAVGLREWTRRLQSGMVHATSRFAYLAALEKAAGFTCSYAGSLDAQGEPFGFQLHRLHKRPGARA